MIIYENDNFRVHALEGTSKYFLVTFSGLRAIEIGSGSFFAEATCKKLGIACAGIVSKREDWYTSEGISEAIKVVQELSARYPIVYGYGSSMGAYCAIKYSRALNFTACLALAPQWSLDLTEFPQHTYFHDFFTQEMSGMGVRGDEISGQINILIDENEEADVLHAEEFRKICPRTNIITLPKCGHNISPFIKGSKQLSLLLSVIEDPELIKIMSRRIRRSNVESLSRVLSAMTNSKPNLVKRALQSNRAKKIGLDTFVYQNHREIVGSVSFSLISQNKRLECFDFLAGSLPMPTGRTDLSMFDFNLIFTHVGEYICYNPLTEEISLSSRTIPLNGFPLVLLGQQIVCLTWSGEISTSLEVEIEKDTDFIFIKKNSLYLCVAPFNKPVINRTSKGLWESFLPVSVRQF